MTLMLQLYKCEICGNIVQVMHNGEGELVCCGMPMGLLVPYEKKDEKGEKHVPVFTKNMTIEVGSVPHPMLTEHHIEFIEALSEDNSEIHIKFLNPGDKPSMDLNSEYYVKAIEYCNIHGLWQGNKE